MSSETPENERQHLAGELILAQEGFKQTAAVSAEVTGDRAQALSPLQAYLLTLHSESSRRTMYSYLNQFAKIISKGVNTADTLPWQHLRKQHVDYLIDVYAKTAPGDLCGLVGGSLSDADREDPLSISDLPATAGGTKARPRLTERPKTRSPRTVKTLLAAVKGVMRCAFEKEMITAHQFMSIQAVKAPRGFKETSYRPLDDDAAMALMRVCVSDATATGARDAALFTVMMGSGLRRAEASGLFLSDYHREAGQLKVIGKGNKERTVDLTEPQRVHLDHWIVQYRGLEPGPLFNRIIWTGGKGPKHVQHDRALSGNGVYYILQHRRKQAGIPMVAPHDLRRTFAKNLLKINASLTQLRQLMGHENITTTADYLRHDREELRDLVEKLPTQGRQQLSNHDEPDR